MKTQQLIIPEKLKVGFNTRNNTYTGKLAFITSYDQKGNLRKKASWENWRNQDIPPVEHLNVPTEGFVLNKDGGGGRGWDSRNEFIRVYDPRDFEFEISVANLVFILKECDCCRGKGLEGKFVYGWDRDKLILLPVNAEDYKNSKAYTKLQSQGVKAKEMILGASYETKKQEILTYIGRFDWHFMEEFKLTYDYKSQTYETTTPASRAALTGVCKKHVFWDGKDFVLFNDLKPISVLISDDVLPDYAAIVSQYNKSSRGSKVVKLFLKDGTDIKGVYPQWYYEETAGVFVACSTDYADITKKDTVVGINTQNKFFIKDDMLISEPFYCRAEAPGQSKSSNYNYNYSKMVIPWREPTKQKLWVKLESGVKMLFDRSKFMKGTW